MDLSLISPSDFYVLEDKLITGNFRIEKYYIVGVNLPDGTVLNQMSDAVLEEQSPAVHIEAQKYCLKVLLEEVKRLELQYEEEV